MVVEIASPWSLRDLLAEGPARSSPSAVEEAASRIDATDADISAWEWRPATLPSPHTPGLLAGVPFGVKDIIDLAGAPTRCGSILNRDAPPAVEHAAIVQVWSALGAVPIGKTVTTEYAYFGPGATRNPRAPGHTPGGSSSGSAAAVAAGHVPFAIGTQTAGSVTRPASFCGVAALVLTHGTFPMNGVTGLSDSLDTHGVFAVTVDDLAAAYDALVATTTELPRRAPRIAIWDPSGIASVEASMVSAVARTRRALASAGADIHELDPHAPALATRAHPIVMSFEAARERSELLPQIERLSRPLAALIMSGAEIARAEYDTARGVLADAGDLIAETLAEFDAILAPAALGPAPAGLGATGDPVLSRAWQGLGLPVVVIPGMLDPTGSPLGLQLIGARNGESELLATACWVEQVLRQSTAG